MVLHVHHGSLARPCPHRSPTELSKIGLHVHGTSGLGIDSEAFTVIDQDKNAESYGTGFLT